ncbi:MAG: response regulator [Elusimicrobia bacterium]|nr:response regulator [Elusimicrobiota bacterium]
MPKKVLVIDDEAEMLQLVKHTLEKGGDFQVSTCDNGRQAWDEIIRIKPDLLVLDVMLPGIDGYSLQLKIAQDPATKDMPIIVLTALEPSKTLFQKFPQVVGFMTKPFRTEDLLQNAQQAIQRSAKTS